MELPMTLIKYGLFIIIMVVASYKIWIEVDKFVKKIKNKGEDSLGFDLEVK